MLAALSIVNEYVWGTWFLALCGCCGIYFSLKTRCVQLHSLAQVWGILSKSARSLSGVSAFQALTMTLANRVGTGNIVGVAQAIAFGGPGAVFWMWVIVFFGAATSFAECCLGQIYRQTIDGQFRGGPAFYIAQGLGRKNLALCFAIVTIVASGFCLTSLQSHTIAASFSHSFGWSPVWVGGGLALSFACIVWGGVHRIAKTTQILVSVMACVYMGLALAIVAYHWQKVPATVEIIFTAAFGQDAVFGGILGSALALGMRRGVFSSEAGQGSAPHAAAAAEVNHPAEQGIIQAIAVYLDTLFVCSTTALMILLTGKYNVYDNTGQIIYAGLDDPNAEVSQFSQQAVEAVFPGLGSAFIAIAILLFAFSSVVAYYYNAETNVMYLFPSPRRSQAITLLRMFMVISVIVGSIYSSRLVWELSDIGVGLMAWINILTLFLLRKQVLACYKSYRDHRVFSAT